MMLSLLLIQIFYSVLFAQPIQIAIGVPTNLGTSGRPATFMVQDAFYDINANSSFLPGYNLTVVARDSRCSEQGGTENAIEFVTNWTNMPAVIGDSCSSSSIAQASIFKVYSWPSISFASTSPQLTDKTRYTYFMRLIGSDAGTASGFAAACLRYGWKTVATLNSQETLHSLVISQFLSEAASGGIKVKAAESFPGNVQNEPLSQLQSLKSSGAVIMVMSCNSFDARTVFRLAASLGMAGQPYVWMGTDSWVTPGLLLPTFNPVTEANCTVCLNNFNNKSNYPLWVQGVIGFTFKASLTPLGEQKRLVVEGIYGTVTTSAFFAYDCALSVAYALRQVLITNAVPWVTPLTRDFRLAIFSAMLNNTFQGITGTNQMDKNGDRQLDVQLLFFGYSTAVDGTVSFSTIQSDTWSSITKNWTNSSNPVIWPGNSTVIPSDTFPFTITGVDQVLQIVFMTLASACMLYGIILFILLCIYWTHKRIQAATPIFLAVILFCTILAQSIVLVIGVTPTDATCTIPLWFGHVAFFAVFACLFFKTFRIWRIWQFKWKMQLNKANSKKLKDSYGLALTHLIASVLFCVLAICTYLAILTGVDRPRVFLEQDPSNSLNLIIRCKSNLAWVGPIYIVEVIMLLACLFICWQIRKVELLRFNESSHISISVFALLLMGIILIPNVLFLTSNVNTLYVLSSVCILLCALTIQSSLFVPKFKAIITKKETNDGFSSNINTRESRKDTSNTSSTK